MFDRASIQLPPHYTRFMSVKTGNEGGIGKLCLYNLPEYRDVSAGILAEYEYLDWDRVRVTVALIKDAASSLYEIHIWKENYMPVVKYPDMK